MKALILTALPEQSKALTESFAASGFELQVEESALFALTKLERERPDVIIAAQELDETSGLEFYEMCREDPNLDLVPIVLLGETIPKNMTDLDEVIPADSVSADVVRTAYRLVLELTRRTYVGQPNNRVAHSGIHGQLGEIGVFELAEWLSRSSKTGRLTIRLGAENAYWYFSKGNLVHAEFQGKSGEDAVLQLMLKSEKNKDGTFTFEPSDTKITEIPTVTIKKTTDQLLLSLAVELDHINQSGLSTN